MPSAFPHEIFDHYSIPAYDAGCEPKSDIGSSILSNKTVVPNEGVLLSKLNPDIARVWREAGRFVKVRLATALVLIIIASALTGLAPVALKLVVDRFTGDVKAPTLPLALLIGLYVLSPWLAR
ncbi:ABC transporter ATP-binding protein, partial [Lacticaseibacillus rhamnosus]